MSTENKKPTADDFMDEARQLAAQCWTDEETVRFTMKPALAEAVAKRIANWMATAAEYARSVEFYRGIIEKAGSYIGAEAYTSDDGSRQDHVLALKLPELVARLVPPNPSIDPVGELPDLQPAQPPPKMKITEEGILIINEGLSGDILQSRQYTHEGIVKLIHSHTDLAHRLAEAEREISWRSPDKFLPQALKKLEECFLSACAIDDRARSEAYGNALGIFRQFLGGMAEREEVERRRHSRY